MKAPMGDSSLVPFCIFMLFFGNPNETRMRPEYDPNVFRM